MHYGPQARLASALGTPFSLLLLISSRGILSDTSKHASTFIQQTLNIHSVSGSCWPLGIQSLKGRAPTLTELATSLGSPWGPQGQGVSQGNAGAVEGKAS